MQVTVAFFGTRVHREGGEQRDIDPQGSTLWGAPFKGKGDAQTLEIMPKDPARKFSYGGETWECEVVGIESDARTIKITVQPIRRVGDKKLRDVYAEG